MGVKKTLTAMEGARLWHALRSLERPRLDNQEVQIATLERVLAEFGCIVCRSLEPAPLRHSPEEDMFRPITQSLSDIYAIWTNLPGRSAWP